MNRREFVRAASAGAAGFILDPGVLYADNPDSVISLPFGDAVIHGWNIDFRQKDLDRYIFRNQESKVDCSLIIPGTAMENLPAIARSNGTQKLFNARITGDVVRMRGWPPRDGNHCTLDFEETRRGKMTKHRFYPVDFRYYTTETDCSIEICSELPVGEDGLRAIARIAREFDEFLPVTTIYVKDFGAACEDCEEGKADAGELKNRGGNADTTELEYRVEISSEDVLHPFFPGIIEWIAFHELAHCLLDKIKDSYIQWPHRVLSEAYESLEGADEGLQKFALLDESNYFSEEFRQKLWGYGHPNENYCELGASALSVLRFYPREFIERTRNNREIRDAAKRILDALACVDGQNATRLIPEYRMLMSELYKNDTAFTR